MLYSAGNFVTGTAIEGRTKVTDFDYTYLPATGEGQEGQYILTVDLPENKKDYILRFATDIDRSLLGQEIENTAYYEGESAQENKTGRTSFMLASASGGSSSRKASIVVNKTSKDTGDRVDGAVFELNWLRGGDINDPVFVRRLSAIGSGSVTFYGLTIDEKYTITEVGAPSGYLLDSHEPEEIIAGTDTEIEFSNTPIKSGSWKPEAIKKLTGTSVWLPFTFEIIDDETGETVITGTTGAVSGSDRVVDFSIISGIDETDILEFEDSHTFDEAEPAGTEHQAAEKTFTMKEITYSSPGYTYDTTEHKLTVSVYNVKGREDLKVIVEDEDGTIISDEDGNILTGSLLEFTNTYTAEGAVQFIASKTLEGHSLAENQFQFQLYEGAAVDPDKLIETVSNNESIYNDGRDYRANAQFTPISYDEADEGTKIYTIVEKQEVNPGYTYDEAVYTIEVEVTHDDGTGVVESEITSIEKTVEGVSEFVDSISFTNIYETTDTDADITATKILSGDILNDQDFSFRLAQVTDTGNFIQEIETVKNNGSSIIFTTLDFTQEDKDKTFYYQVTEIPEDRPGYDFDDSVFTVEIKVIDNQDGTLRTEKIITKDGEEVNQIVFQNIYSSIGILSLTAKKALEGRTLKENQFSFEIQELDALKGNPVGEKQLVKNDGKGMIVFPELSYTEADGGKTFYYQISEVNDNQKGYTYDDTLYMVSITVTDNKDGTLNIEKEVVEPENITDIIFKNSYKADEVNNTNQNTGSTNSPTLIERILSPKTGDSLPIMVYAAVILVSSLGLVYLGYKRKRNRL